MLLKLYLGWNRLLVLFDGSERVFQRPELCTYYSMVLPYNCLVPGDLNTRKSLDALKWNNIPNSTGAIFARFNFSVDEVKAVFSCKAVSCSWTILFQINQIRLFNCPSHAHMTGWVASSYQKTTVLSYVIHSNSQTAAIGEGRVKQAQKPAKLVGKKPIESSHLSLARAGR